MTKRRKYHKPEQIIKKLREAETMLAAGKTIGQVYQTLEVSEQAYERWKKKYGDTAAGDALTSAQLVQDLGNWPCCRQSVTELLMQALIAIRKFGRGVLARFEQFVIANKRMLVTIAMVGSRLDLGTCDAKRSTCVCPQTEIKDVMVGCVKFSPLLTG
jgi:hypothetical protein